MFSKPLASWVIPTLAALGFVFAGALVAQQSAAPGADSAAAVKEAFAAAKDRLKEVAPGKFTLGEIQIDAASREIRLPCVVVHREVQLEYILVHETGKEHETLLTTSIQPMDLQVAMLLAHYSPGSKGLFDRLPSGQPKSFEEAAPPKPDSHRLKIQAEWVQKGELVSVPLSSWVRRAEEKSAPEDLTEWLFTGSRITNQGFVADVEGSFIALYADRNAIVNSPAFGNHRDDIWSAMTEVIPPEKTAVTLVIRPAIPAQ